MIIQTTRMRFMKNLGQGAAWAVNLIGYICAVATVVALLVLFGSLGDESLMLRPFSEVPYCLLIGAWRVFLYAVLPLLAWAAFKTWVLKR